MKDALTVGYNGYIVTFMHSHKVGGVLERCSSTEVLVFQKDMESNSAVANIKYVIYGRFITRLDGDSTFKFYIPKLADLGVHLTPTLLEKCRKSYFVGKQINFLMPGAMMIDRDDLKKFLEKELSKAVKRKLTSQQTAGANGV